MPHPEQELQDRETVATRVNPFQSDTGALPMVCRAPAFCAIVSSLSLLKDGEFQAGCAMQLRAKRRKQALSLNELK